MLSHRDDEVDHDRRLAGGLLGEQIPFSGDRLW
jgi:hypothetical protein